MLDYLSETWVNLKWTPWYTFDEVRNNTKLLPDLPGVYRIKAIGINKIIYIGQTGVSLRNRVTTLIRESNRNLMPYNDPHTAAPALWAWTDDLGWQYECSVSEVTLLKVEREALECNLLRRYRLEANESTYSNHGRFHPNYIKSSNRKRNEIGGKVSPRSTSGTRWGESYPALRVEENSGNNNFMGLVWNKEVSPLAKLNISDSSGVYMIEGKESGEILYIGQSSNIKNRIKTHIKRQWGEDITIHYHVIPNAKEFHLYEVENDLIGGHYEQFGRPPKYQFKS